MTTPAEAHVLAVAITVSWSVLVIRFLVMLHRRLVVHAEKSTELGVKWSIWAIAFFIVMAGTTYHPASIHFFENTVGEWFGTVPRTISALMPYIIGAPICCGFMPTYWIPRWRWPTYGGILLIIVYALILRISGSNLVYWRATLADPLFHFFILLATVRIIIPSLFWLRVHEEYATMHVKLTLLIAMYVIICVWMMSDIVAAFLQAANLPRDFLEPIRPFRVIGVASTFLLAYFAPPRLLQWIAEGTRYVSYLVRVPFVCRVERCVCSWTGFDLSPIGLKDIVNEPDLVIYRSAITTLDARKLLSLYPEGSEAWNLARRLELVAQSELQFQELVARLSRIGRDCFFAQTKSCYRLCMMSSSSGADLLEVQRHIT
jgi:hypothetical protein